MHVLACVMLAIAAAVAEEPAQRVEWHANWISHPTAPLREAGVFHFRKILDLESRPARFLVHVSADNRFILFVNGRRVGEGPARGDLPHWRYETFDLALFFVAGRNVIAATVWNFGMYAPIAQISDRTAFLVEGDSKSEQIVNTDGTWEVEAEQGHWFSRGLPEGLSEYYAAGPAEQERRRRVRPT